MYYLHGIASEAIRGGHAHYTEEEILIAVHGSFRVRIVKDTEFTEHFMQRRDEGL